jgi:hypothetical protein
MGFRLNADEQRAFLERGHTAIVTTVKRDGFPVSLPVWFVLVDESVYIATPPGAAKLTRLRNDDRVWFLVEQGLKWVDLKAVGFPARGVILDPGSESDRVMKVFDAKYADFRPPTEGLPRAVTEHYSDQVVIRLDPVGSALTWDNSQIRMNRG